MMLRFHLTQSSIEVSPIKNEFKSYFTMKDMKKKILNKFYNIEVLQTLFVFGFLIFMVACSPMGGHVNEDKSDNHYYNLFHTKIIFGSMGNCWNIGCEDIYGADVSSFEPLNGVYAVDNENVYYREKRIKHEIPRYFSLLGYSFAIGKRGVYCEGKRITKNSPNSFSVLKVNHEDQVYRFGIGEKHVYDNFCRKISDEPKAFYYVGQYYFADSKYLYNHVGWIIDDINPKTFRLLKDKSGEVSIYALDKENIYSMVGKNKIVANADYDTFEVICTGSDYPELAKDKNHVYGYERIIEGLNPNDYNYPETCEKYKGKSHIDW